MKKATQPRVASINILFTSRLILAIPPKPINKICVIGDSHVGAFKMGWDSIKDQHPGYDVVFFATPKKSMSQLKTDGKKIFFERSKSIEKLEALMGLKEVDVSDFQSFICVGMTNATHQIVRWQLNHSIADSKLKSKPIVSSNAFVDTWVDKFESSPLSVVMERLKEASAKNILVVLRPHPSYAILKDGTDTSLAQLYEQFFNDPAEIDLVNSILRDGLSKVLPEGARFVPQPSVTTVKNLLTKEEFSVGSVPLRQGEDVHDVDDHNHMNQKYGEIFWDEILSSMEQTP